MRKFKKITNDNYNEIENNNLNHTADTFKSASNVQIAIVIQFPDIASIQPSVVIKRFTRFTFTV